MTVTERVALLASALEVVDPHVLSLGADEHDLSWISHWRAGQPTHPYAGFEIPLSGAPWAGVHQAFEPADAVELARALRDGEVSTHSLAPLPHLLRSLPHLEHAIVEYDVVSGEVARTPSTFFTFREADGVTAANEIEGALIALTERFTNPAADLGSRVRECISACPDGASVTSIGFMLGRSDDHVRLNVRRIYREDVQPFLEALCWNGDDAELHDALTLAFAWTDRVTLALDIGTEGLGPRLGLECGFVDPATSFDCFLRRLVALGSADETVVSRVLSWPGADTPASIRWPDALVLAAITDRSDETPAVLRWINHVKLSIDESGRSAAKAYVGFRHGALPQEPAGRHIVARDPRRDVPGAERLQVAAVAARDYLLSSRTPGGLWSEYPRSFGPSDEWTSAYVGSALATGQGRRARAAAEACFELLLERLEVRAGLGWNAGFPPDADTTSWVIRLANLLGRSDDDRIRRAGDFVEQHRLACGGYASFLSRNLPTEGPFAPAGSDDGWCATEHDCVTASIAGLRTEHAVLERLASTQRSDGRWISHWWWDDAYATALATEALQGRAPGVYPQTLEKARDWALPFVAADGTVNGPRDGRPSAFTAALVLRTILATDPHASEARKVLRWLERTQRDDGSWVPSAALLFPLPEVVEPVRASTVCDIDHRSILTTATVLMALQKAADLGVPSHVT